MIPLRSTSKWPTIAVYDCEATKWVNLFLICHVDELGNRKTFSNKSAYISWLFSDAFRGTHVWAHWGGHYDHRYLVEEAHRRGWSFEVIMSGGLMIVITIKDKRGREITFCDSGRIMPDSAKKIGESIGLPKLDVNRGALDEIPIDEAITYCFRDCDIILKALQAMRDTLTAIGADFAYTLASMAARWVRRSDVLIWEKLCVRTGKKKFGPSEEMLAADAWCEPAYFGGRCEVFKRGKFDGPLYYYDIRSSYPWSMLSDLPTYFRGFHPPLKSARASLSRCGISEATVSVPPDTYLPVLPVRHQGKLVFPVGRFSGRWCNEELRAAMDAGAKVEVGLQAVFEPAPFLRPFVETFYRLRREAIEKDDAFRAYAFKILLNSCYGKLIEAVERSAIIFGRDNVRDALEEDKELYPTPIAGLYTVKSEEQGPFRHVAAGAAITASSRLLLHRRLHECASQGRIYYADTDSILTDVRLQPEPDELGNLKLEAEVDACEIVAPKVYRLSLANGKTIFKCKGVPIRSDDADASRKKFEAYVNAGRDGTLGAKKEGVTGFLSDIRRGQIAMSATELHRGLRKHDSKRRHDGPSSVPVSL